MGAGESVLTYISVGGCIMRLSCMCECVCMHVRDEYVWGEYVHRSS